MEDHFYFRKRIRLGESVKDPGLFFIGEVLDVDAFTGGFNLQIALSTAYSCAMAIKE